MAAIDETDGGGKKGLRHARLQSISAVRSLPRPLLDPSCRGSGPESIKSPYLGDERAPSAKRVGQKVGCCKGSFGREVSVASINFTTDELMLGQES